MSTPNASANPSFLQRLLLNVGGDKYEFSSWQIFTRYPTSRLGKLSGWSRDDNNALLGICDDYNLEKNEFFFNRNSKTFSSVLSFYYTGKLHMPDGICVVAYAEDLKYWGTEESYLDSCCFHKYFQLLEQITEEANELDEISCVLYDDKFGDGLCGNCRQSVWNAFEKPSSSLLAKIIALISIISIVTSTVVLALSTVTELQMYECLDDTISCEETELELEAGILTTENNTTEAVHNEHNRIPVENYYLVLAEEICMIWFTFEYFTRLVVSRNKCAFLKDLFNIFDLIAILPYYIILALLLINSSGADQFQDIRKLIQICRLMRITRIFKLARHSPGLQSFLYTLRASYKELGILFLLLVIGVLLFSSFAFYAERDDNADFESIPATFWWAVVTMNAVGLGNMEPVTTTGKFISFICGVCGMLFIGLPIPIIVDSFAAYYSEQNERLKIVKKYQSLQLEGNDRRDLKQIMAENHHHFLRQFVEIPEVEIPNELIHIKSSSSRPILNVGGASFEVTWNLLILAPNSRLGQLRHCTSRKSLLRVCDDYSTEKNEYIFHRDPKPFNSILGFYFTGKFHLLEDSYCPVAFEEEMRYWNIDESQLEMCCHYTYSRKRQRILKEMKEIECLLAEDEQQENFGNGVLGKLRKHVWNVLEHSSSSNLAQLFSLISTIITMLSAVVLSIMSLPIISEVENECAISKQEASNVNCDENSAEIYDQQKYNFPLRAEFFCIAWFAGEYILRFIVSPNKLDFMRRKLDSIDPLIVISYFTTVFLLGNEPGSGYDQIGKLLRNLCETLKILRLLRILKLGKHNTALQALGYTLKSSLNHMGVLLLFLAVGVLVFSSLAYICEKDENASQFVSIPATFWWALVTMHALTVGDMQASTISGKVVSFLCGLFGVLFLVLPIPIISSNFNEFYKKKMRIDRAQKRFSRDGLNLNSSEMFENEENVA